MNNAAKLEAFQEKLESDTEEWIEDRLETAREELEDAFAGSIRSQYHDWREIALQEAETQLQAERDEWITEQVAEYRDQLEADEELEPSW